MLIVIVCGALLAVGIVLIVAWGGEPLVAPRLDGVPAGGAIAAASGMRRHALGLRTYLWWATLFTVIATASTVLIVGAGGRLVMRALAMTSPEATGRITEAQATVGEISPEGTATYLLFGALPFAFASALLYLIVEPWLPRGRLGGPVFGVTVFIAVSPFVDPLRAENIDFDLVGPGWLAIALFGALSVAQGAALAAIAGRLSRSLPIVSRHDWAPTAVGLLPAVVLLPVGALLAIGALVAFALPRLVPDVLAMLASRGGVTAGRVLLVLAVALALPAFAAATGSIWVR
ncbi:hypothetical protein [Agromyces sp. Marseille-Q5079]|uniref:hypothetical protein n=1 Tax=Agromyces sp. Marseille-Q5079 TaxID=3439059 RepID=UPI003D9C8CD4